MFWHADHYSPRDKERWRPEPPKSAYRTDFERDRARVLHSSALRRLGAKTQVLAPVTDDFIRTRLTHSLEVAQVGRELGRVLGCDPDIVDAACLSHDLGHPPFGHNGEKALHEAAAGIGGFEGNAQTLRILTRLEPKVLHDDGRPAGLNLTRASLDAACKYPWAAADAPLKPNGLRSSKFGAYDDDLPVFSWIRRGAPEGRACMEAQVMDLSDDISYSVHDVEDAIVGGHLQLKWVENVDQRARVIGYTREWYLPETSPADVDAALARLEMTPGWVRESSGSRADMARIKNMTSGLIGRFASAAFEATRATYDAAALTRYAGSVVVPEETWLEIAVLKGLATTFVMESDMRQPLYARQREILLELVDELNRTGEKWLEPMFAGDLAEAAGDAERLRIVVDQVASLTDRSALDLYERIFGGTPSLL
nr:deoxyguanosinetriphosphate triphosphohydrolase [Falsarthrobacter nasiphocae]